MLKIAKFNKIILLIILILFSLSVVICFAEKDTKDFYDPNVVFKGMWRTDSGSVYEYREGEMICVSVHRKKGADSISASLKAGQHVEIDNIKSIATSLGAKKVAKATYDWCHKHEVVSHVVSDTKAIESCLKFSNDHRILVEPACGASLTALYNPVDFLKDRNCILIIVCGGAGVTISQLEAWKQKLDQG